VLSQCEQLASPEIAEQVLQMCACKW